MPCFSFSLTISTSATEWSSGNESTDMEDRFDLELSDEWELLLPLPDPEFFGYLTVLVFPEHCIIKRSSSSSSALKLTWAVKE